MTVAASRSTPSSEKFLLRALAISIALHVVLFGGWKWGQAHGWWKRLALPRWMAVVTKKFTPGRPLQLPPPKPQTPAPVLYIDVDPALASPTPPVKPKFYSSADTVAANPEKKIPSDVPQISGPQKEMMKTIASGEKSFPLQPSPPKVEPITPTEANPPPKPALTAGDTASTKPAEKIQDQKGTAQNQSRTAVETEPPRPRPRTLAEARERMGIPGPLGQQDGGVNKISGDIAMDAMRTVYGDYDRDFIDAVRTCWLGLLKDRENLTAGKVIVEFNLHADGRISDVKTTAINVGPIQELICREGIEQPAPYKPWPQKMRQEIPDPREIRFTFSYLNN